MTGLFRFICLVVCELRLLRLGVFCVVLLGIVCTVLLGLYIIVNSVVIARNTFYFECSRFACNFARCVVGFGFLFVGVVLLLTVNGGCYGGFVLDWFILVSVGFLGFVDLCGSVCCLFGFGGCYLVGSCVACVVVFGGAVWWFCCFFGVLMVL